jgi:PAS domain S-box-containing protein
MISIQDTEFRIVRANKAVRDAFGLSADEIIGQRCHRFFHCTDSPPDHCPHARLLADGTCVESEFFEPHLNGYFNVRVRPVLNSQGEIAGCVHIAREVTERKRMEDDLARKVVELKKSNEESRALLAATRTLLEQHDFEESARRIFGITEDVTGAASGYVAMLSQDGVFNDLLYLDSGGMECTVDPSLPMPIRGLRADAYRTGKPVYENDFSSSQWVDLMPAGHVPLSNVLFAPLVIDSRAIGLLGLANKPGGFDEDDARIVAGFAEFAAIALRSSQAAEALRDSEERFRQLAENIGEGFWLTEPGNAWRLAYVSPALERMWGRGKQDFYATEDRGFQYLHSDHKDSAAEAYRVFLETLDEFSVEYRIIGADGALRWIWDRAFPVMDKHGKLHRVAGVTQDVTKRKIDQKRQEELIDEIKRFAYIISHDLRAPLVNLRGFSDELERAMEIVRPAIDAGLANLSEEMNQQVKLAVDGEIPESLQFIKSSVSRMDRLVSGILKLSRLGRSELAVEPLDMNRLATETLELFAHQISEKGIKVTVDYLPNVLADRTAMEQITANLLSNAINYLDPNRGGEIHLSGVRGETETVYHVRDNGIGVKEEDLDKVFEVFHRGDHEVPGEGMGLAYVRTLIRRHNGRIWCESTPGVGSVFSFAIPHHAPPEAD